MDTMFWRDLLINVIANLVSNIIFLIITPIGIFIAYKVGLRQGKNQLPLEERFAVAMEAIELAETKFPGSGQGTTFKFPWAVRYYMEKLGVKEEEARIAINDAFSRSAYANRQVA